MRRFLDWWASTRPHELSESRGYVEMPNVAPYRVTLPGYAPGMDDQDDSPDFF